MEITSTPKNEYFLGERWRIQTIAKSFKRLIDLFSSFLPSIKIAYDTVRFTKYLFHVECSGILVYWVKMTRTGRTLA